MNNPPNYKSLIKKYEAMPSSIKMYFNGLDKMLTDYTYEVSVAFVFLRLEQAYNRSLYGGVRKIHKVHSEVASSILSRQHLTREGFLELFENVFGRPLDSEVVKKIKFAERIRDKVIHGKSVPDKDKRKCLADVLDYAVEIERWVKEIANFSPFDDMRGITGQAKPLDKTTSKWLMKGLGFTMS